MRLQAAEMFARNEKNAEIARILRVTERSVERWRRAWREGGERALLSKGPPARPKLTPAQFARLEAELERGPLAHGFADQRWTLMRIKTLIDRMFLVSYTVPGVWALLHRNGWSCRRPVRQMPNRDEVAIEVWKKEVWPQDRRRRRGRPGELRRPGPR